MNSFDSWIAQWISLLLIFTVQSAQNSRSSASVVRTTMITPSVSSYISQDDQHIDDKNYLKLGKVKGQSKSRILLNFDIARLAQRVHDQNQQIVDAQVYLNCIETYPYQISTIDVMASLIKQDWSANVTWLYRDGESESWNAPYLDTNGMDAMFTAESMSLHLGACNDSAVAISILHPVQRWLASISASDAISGAIHDGNGIYGLLIWVRNDHFDTGSVRFASSQHPIPAQRPWIEISFAGKKE